MNKSYCFILLSTFGGAPRLAVSVVVSNPCAGVVGFIEQFEWKYAGVAWNVTIFTPCFHGSSVEHIIYIYYSI